MRSGKERAGRSRTALVSESLVFPPFRLDLTNERLWRGKRLIPLKPQTFAVLHYLVEHPGRLVTKRELFDQLWGDVHVSDAVLKTHVGELRRVLGDDARSPKFIETAHRRGYRFVAPVQTAPSGHQLSSGDQELSLLSTASDGVARIANIQATAACQLGTALSTGATVTRQVNNLPLPLTEFVGRETELCQVAALIGDSNVRLVTILGPGGMGKSRLALEATHRLIARRESLAQLPPQGNAFAHGVFFVDLAPLSCHSLVPSALAEAVGFQFYSGGQPWRQLLDYFRERSLLLLMDNFEHLIEGAAIVRDILEVAGGIKVLVTSRQRLGLSAETSLLLTGMELPGTAADDALASAAVKLFMQSAQRVSLDFACNAQTAPAVSRICQLVQGTPLCIVLAAAWVGVLSAREIADEIGTNLDFLEVKRCDVPERQQSMRVVFERSMAMLSGDERATFSRLSVFRGGFTRVAAEFVAQTNLLVLAALVNKSLIQRVPKTGRYETHELLRQYAENELRQTKSDHYSTLDRHAGHYAQFLADQGVRIKGLAQRHALEEIDSEIGNIRAAWAVMLDRQDIGKVAIAIEGLSLFYELRALGAEAEAAFRRLVEAFSPEGHVPMTGSAAIVSLALSLQVACLVQQGRYQGLRELIAHAINLSDEAIHPRERAFALVTAAYALIGIETDPQIAAWADEGLALYRVSNDPWGLARALLLLTRMHLVHEDLAKAEANLRECLTIQRSFGDRTVILPNCLVALGYTRACRGHPQEGLELVLDGLAIAEKIDDRGVELGLQQLALVLHGLGDHAAAEAAARRGLAVCEKTGNRFAMAWTHIALGDILKARGRLVEAATHYRACLGHGREDALATAQLNLGDIAMLHGEHVEAGQLLRESLRRFENAAIHWGVIVASQNLGYLACEEGEYGLALEHFRAAHRTGFAVNADRFIGSTGAGLALLLARTDRKVAAVELLGLAKFHPATEHFTQQRRITPLLHELNCHLSEIEVSAALERGKTLSLEIVFRDLSVYGSDIYQAR